MARMSVMIREKVCALVKQRVPAGSKVLEVSCALGRNLAILRDAGYEVRGTNFSEYEKPVAGVEIDLGVDVMKGLPYDDASFDCVLLCDIIEHLSDHDAAIRHMSRVLRPGGLLIIVTPNIMRINSRLHFLFTGFFKIKRSFIGFDVPQGQSFAFHNYPPHLPTLAYQLHSHGLDTELDAIEYKPKSIVMWLLFFPLIWPMTWINLSVSEKFLKGTAAATGLGRLLTSFKSLCGEAMVILASKRAVATDTGAMKTTLPEWSTKIGGS